MTAGAAEPWARLRLVQGDSSAQMWELVASRGQTTLTVGSGPSSSWVVTADGVRPLHFSLHWDGETLRIADTYGAGDVRLDGGPVTAQWRTLAGRARVEFGKAAMVAETSVTMPEDTSHPLEPSPLPAAPEAEPAVVEPSEVQAAATVPSTRVHKATLIGVSPLATGVTASAEPVMGGAAAEPPSSQSGSSFQPARPDSERARKATLLGMAINVPPAAAVPQDAQQTQPILLTQPGPTGPSKGIPSGTLIGVAGPLEVRVQRFASVSDQATPGAVRVDLDAMRVGGAPSGKVEPAIGSVTQAEVRTVSAPPTAMRDRTERIGSTWQETSGPDPVPAAVMIGAAQPSVRGLPEQPDSHPSFDGYDTYGDIPTQMREGAGLESRRPGQTFPWRYVGIGVLTAAAYFAWLYLLDHL